MEMLIFNADLMIYYVIRVPTIRDHGLKVSTHMSPLHLKACTIFTNRIFRRCAVKDSDVYI